MPFSIRFPDSKRFLLALSGFALFIAAILFMPNKYCSSQEGERRQRIAFVDVQAAFYGSSQYASFLATRLERAGKHQSDVAPLQTELAELQRELGMLPPDTLLYHEAMEKALACKGVLDTLNAKYSLNDRRLELQSSRDIYRRMKRSINEVRSSLDLDFIVLACPETTDPKIGGDSLGGFPVQFFWKPTLDVTNLVLEKMRD